MAHMDLKEVMMTKIVDQPKELQGHTRSFAQRLHNEKKTMLPAWVGGCMTEKSALEYIHV